MTIRREDLDTLDFSDVASPAKTRLAPIHPGEILLEDFLTPLGISQYALAKAIDVPPRRINEIVHGKRGITVDTALRLGRFFGTSAQFWSNLQTGYEFDIAETQMRAILSRIPASGYRLQQPPRHSRMALAGI
ncbi:MAG: HigA family addiction module antidote protein [Zoogloeaceae bacterium]|jgi:addiction module HigA family antidote|nr:HigA family addiction module antidote protein [Zoogloeaceae bacterium]